MKRMMVILLLFLSIDVHHSFAQSNWWDEPEKGDVGIGVQASYPFYGLSMIFNIKDKVGIQGIFGSVSRYKSLSGRILLYLKNESNHSVYAFGLYGSYGYEEMSLNFDTYELEEKTKSTLGYGFGFGVEYTNFNVTNRIPIWINLEICYGNIDFGHHSDIDISATIVGAGIHYYLKY